MTVSFIGWGNRSTWKKQPTCRKSLTNLSHNVVWTCIQYTSSWMGLELTTLVVIGTDCIGSCNSNYHMIMTTTALTMNGTGIITKYILPTKFVGSQWLHNTTVVPLLQGHPVQPSIKSITWNRWNHWWSLLALI
jgi:hypothetical protein